MINSKYSEIQINNIIDDKGTFYKNSVILWGRKHFRQYPWRSPSVTPYEILVAELLLKRTTATSASRVYNSFINRFPTFNTIVEVDEKELVEILSAVGLQSQRAKAIKGLAYYILEKYDGKIPNDIHQLLRIPGLGEYSARAIMSFGYNIPMAIVDTNVKRVLVRIFRDNLPTKPPGRLIQNIADFLLIADSHREYNFALLDLGSLVCRSIDPLHNECPLLPICDYNNQKDSKLFGDPPVIPEDNIGIRIRTMRHKKGISLVKLALISGVSKLTIINIEHGKTIPMQQTIDKIAHTLGLDLDK